AMHEQLIARIRTEFLEMPGLHLTLAQARRLWHVDESVCRAALDELVHAKFLTRHANGAFTRQAEHRLHTAKPRAAKPDLRDRPSHAGESDSAGSRAGQHARQPQRS